MKIAFDVKGTLIGHNQDKVVRLFRALQEMGHEMFVWSSVLSYTFDAVKLHGLNVDTEHLFSKYGASEAVERGLPIMDLAVDDEAGDDSYLAAQMFVNVHNIPDNVEEFAETVSESFEVTKTFTKPV